jgi:hypothetical protein
MSNSQQDVSTAELGHVDPRSSIDGDEATSLLPSQRQQQPSGTSNYNNSKRLSTASNGSGRSLSEKGRKKIIITLAAISGALIVILVFALVGKVGAPPGTVHLYMHSSSWSMKNEGSLVVYGSA